MDFPLHCKVWRETWHRYPFMERQMFEVCTGVGKSLQGMCQIKRCWEIVAICAQNCVHHRQILRVVLSLQHSSIHDTFNSNNSSFHNNINPITLLQPFDVTSFHCDHFHGHFSGKLVPPKHLFQNLWVITGAGGLWANALPVIKQCQSTRDNSKALTPSCSLALSFLHPLSDSWGSDAVPIT